MRATCLRCALEVPSTRSSSMSTAAEPRELQMLLPLLEALDAALAPEALVVKNAPLKRLLMRASLVDALPNAWSLALAPSGDGALLRREYKRCM
mmetsp:Transcript_24167/g.77361  ORF Transcript_24167/g.77361 Transcript_24167/m.77361 type:complete len:94 (+) Transcript_24167:502-783(+)